MKKTLFLLVLLGTSLLGHTQSQMDQYDLKYCSLDLELSNSHHSVSGNASYLAEVLNNQMDTFVIELLDSVGNNLPAYCMVDSVKLSGLVVPFTHEYDLVKVPLSNSPATGSNLDIQIFYHGKAVPTWQSSYNGIIRKVYAGMSETHSYSQPFYSRMWWPCKQVLTDKIDSLDFYITTDSLNRTGSNGLLSSTEYLMDGRVKYKWESRYPIAYYLVSFVVGPYLEHKTYAPLPNTTDSILIQSLFFPNSPLNNHNIKVVEKTKELLWLFSELYGTYPFKDEKYGYSVIGTQAGAMEHQTMTTIGYNAMDTTLTLGAGVAYWFTAHELAHHWFGDQVTCKNWNHIWINEGFASYSEYIALEELESKERADLWMTYAHLAVTSNPWGSIYLNDSLAQFTQHILNYSLSYKKGASIIHSLRYEIDNDSIFYEILRNFLSSNDMSVAGGDDFQSVVEAHTNADYSDFFMQWYYGEGFPTFDISWQQDANTATVVSEQTGLSPLTPLFKTHFDLRIEFADGDTVLRLYQGQPTEIFSFNFDKQVIDIEVDPHNWIINDANITPLNVETISTVNDVLLFPNPAQDQLTVLCDTPCEWQVYSIVGRKLMSTNETTIDISELAPGNYFLKGFSKDGSNVGAIRFVKTD